MAERLHGTVAARRLGEKAAQWRLRSETQVGVGSKVDLSQWTPTSPSDSNFGSALGL